MRMDYASSSQKMGELLNAHLEEITPLLPGENDVTPKDFPDSHYFFDDQKK